MSDTLIQAAELPKFTPGEWTTGITEDGVPYVYPGGQENKTAWPWICEADMESAEGEDLMNGVLMAAAPTLLEACNIALFQCFQNRPPTERLEIIKDAVCRAIEKATTPPAVIAEQPAEVMP